LDRDLSDRVFWCFKRRGGGQSVHARENIGVILDVQFNSATTPWPSMRDAALAAQDGGFGVVWVVDHLAGQVMGGPSMMECFTLVGALAACTSTIGVGTLVANVWNRPISVLAAAAATAQQIAEGRFWLGIGAGASPRSPFGAEHAAVGIELDPLMAHRHQRVVDFVEFTRSAWAGGEHNGVTGFAVPDLIPPLIIGVNSVALAVIAARLADGINLRASHPRSTEIINAARDARDPALPPLIVSVWTQWDQTLRDPNSVRRQEFASLGIDRVVLTQFEPVDLALITAKK
jgi:alkanesulfonate monooxygenase SsuD/methylene tetrahydromethanopterin reductase-like flavin-dependent oxidoreductase (luciferase family)